jgi:hypothetical protein
MRQSNSSPVAVITAAIAISGMLGLSVVASRGSTAVTSLDELLDLTGGKFYGRLVSVDEYRDEPAIVIGNARPTRLATFTVTVVDGQRLRTSRRVTFAVSEWHDPAYEQWLKVNEINFELFTDTARDDEIVIALLIGAC